MHLSIRIILEIYFLLSPRSNSTRILFPSKLAKLRKGTRLSSWGTADCIYGRSIRSLTVDNREESGNGEQTGFWRWFSRRQSWFVTESGKQGAGKKRFEEENWNWNVCLHECRPILFLSLSLHGSWECVGGRYTPLCISDGSGLKLMQRVRVLKNHFVPWLDARGGGKLWPIGVARISRQFLSQCFALCFSFRKLIGTSPTGILILRLRRIEF